MAAPALAPPPGGDENRAHVGAKATPKLGRDVRDDRRAHASFAVHQAALANAGPSRYRSGPRRRGADSGVFPARIGRALSDAIAAGMALPIQPRSAMATLLEPTTAPATHRRADRVRGDPPSRSPRARCEAGRQGRRCCSPSNFRGRDLPDAIRFVRPRGASRGRSARCRPLRSCEPPAACLSSDPRATT
jgi:hypothetical protein